MKPKHFGIFFFLAVSTATASLVPPIDVPQLVASADLIVVGRAGETRDTFDKTSHDFIEVDQVIKGALDTKRSVVDLDSSRFLNTGTSPYGIFFLRRLGARFQIVDQQYPFLVASPVERKLDLLSSSHTNDEALASVAHELCNVFRLPQSFVIDRKSGLRQQLGVSGIPNGEDAAGNQVFKETSPTNLGLAEAVYRQAADALRSIPFARQQSCLAEIVDGAHGALGAVWALALMVANGDRSRIAHHLNEFVLLRQEAFWTGKQIAESVGGGLAMTDDDVPWLSALLRSNNQYVREGATDHLAIMHTLASTASLEIGLQDPVAWNRRHAAVLICAITHECDVKRAGSAEAPTNVHDIEAALARWIEKNRDEP